MSVFISDKNKMSKGEVFEYWDTERCYMQQSVNFNNMESPILQLPYMKSNEPIASKLNSNTGKGGLYLYWEIDATGNALGSFLSKNPSEVTSSRRMYCNTNNDPEYISNDILAAIDGVIVFGGDTNDGNIIFPDPQTVSFFHKRGIKVFANFMIGQGWDSCAITKVLKEGETATSHSRVTSNYPLAKNIATTLINLNVDGIHFNVEDECTDPLNAISWPVFFDNIIYYGMVGGKNIEILSYQATSIAQNIFNESSNPPYQDVILPRLRATKINADDGYSLSSSDAQLINSASSSYGIPASKFIIPSLMQNFNSYTAALNGAILNYSIFRQTTAAVSSVKTNLTKFYLQKQYNDYSFRTYFNAGRGNRWFILSSYTTQIVNAYGNLLNHDLPCFYTENAASSSIDFNTGFYGGSALRLQAGSPSTEGLAVVIDIPYFSIDTTITKIMYMDIGYQGIVERVDLITNTGDIYRDMGDVSNNDTTTTTPWKSLNNIELITNTVEPGIIFSKIKITFKIMSQGQSMHIGYLSLKTTDDVRSKSTTPSLNAKDGGTLSDTTKLSYDTISTNGYYCYFLKSTTAFMEEKIDVYSFINMNTDDTTGGVSYLGTFSNVLNMQTNPFAGAISEKGPVIYHFDKKGDLTIYKVATHTDVRQFHFEISPMSRTNNSVDFITIVNEDKGGGVIVPATGNSQYRVYNEKNEPNVISGDRAVIKSAKNTPNYSYTDYDFYKEISQSGATPPYYIHYKARIKFNV